VEPTLPSAMKRGRDEGGKAHFDRGVPHTKYAFKILCTDSFAGVLLRDRAATKEDVQTECGVRLVFSNQGDYFPATSFRVMGIYSDEIENIAHTFDRIMPILVEQADEERDRPAPEGSQLLGKELGEYVFRLILSRQMGGLLIGHKGANINKLRDDTGAKVFIENDNHLEHRMVRLIGTRQQIIACLQSVKSLIEDDCETEDFQMYAGLVNFAEASSRGGADGNGYGGPSGPPRPRPERRDERRDEKRGRRDGRDGRGRRDGRDRRDGGRRGSRDRAEERSVDAPTSHESAAAWETGPGGSSGGASPLEAVAKVVGGFPQQMQTSCFGISCHIPSDLVPALCGRGAEFTQRLMETSETEISIDAEGRVEIQGLILNVYLAHASLMKRFHEVEEEQNRPAEKEQVLAMQSQIEELQRQLELVKAAGRR